MRCFSTLLCFIFCAFCSGQGLVFRNYTTADGLNTNTIHHVFQDSKGYIWLSTDLGVTRFDGNEFESFSESDGLVGGQIFGAAEDSVGNVWFHSYQRKLMYYSPEKDSFFQPEFNNELENVAQRFFQKIDFHHNAIYLSGQKGNIIEIKVDKDSNWIVQELFSDVDGFVLFRLDSVKFTFNNLTQNFPLQNKIQVRGFDNLNISHEHIKADGVFYSAWRSHKKKSFILSSNNSFVELNDHKEWAFYKKRFVSTLAFSEDGSGDFWFGSFDNGLFRYQGGDLGVNPLNYLEGETVSSILFDQHDGLWVSTLGSGLYYTPDIRVQSLLSSEGMQVLSCDLLLENEILYCIHKGNNQVSLMVESQFPIWFDHVNLKDPILFADTWNDALYLKLRNNSTLKKVNTNGVASTGIKSTSVRASEGYLISHYYRWGEGQITFFNEEVGENHVVSDVGIRGLRLFLSVDSNRFYYAEPQGEINYVAFNRDSVTIKDCDTNLSKVDFIDLIKLSSDRNALISKSKGIFIFNAENLVELVYPFFTSDTILNAVSLDNNGMFYFLTNKGIYRSHRLFDKPELFLNKNLGLPSDNVNRMVNFGDKLIFATDNGIVFVESSFEPRSNLESLLTHITLEVDGKEVKSLGDLSFPHNFSNLNFFFLAISYESAFNIQYRYRLKSTEGWNVLEGQSLMLTSLQPSEYLLEVQANGPYGNWGESAFVSFVINPPFWQEPEFIALIMLAFILLGIYISRFRVQRLKRQIALENELLKAQNQALSSQLKPHFIFNSMNSLVAFISTKDEKNSLRYLANLSKLMRSIFDSSESNMITIAKEIESLENYLELEKLRFDISYKIECDQGVSEFMIPPLLFQPLVENAVVHGVEEDHGMIRIRIQSLGGLIVGTVDNSGKPLIIEQLNERTGSLAMIKRRLAILKTLKNLDIGLTITAMNEDGFVTRAEITFPKIKI